MIRFVELFDQVELKEAVARLSVTGDQLSVAKRKTHTKKQSPKDTVISQAHEAA